MSCLFHVQRQLCLCPVQLLAIPRPLLDAAEKERCALLMQHRGKLPAAAVAGTSGARSQSAGAPQPRRPAPKSEAEELQSLFSQVLQEIEERKAFLADLESYGALKRDVQQQLQGVLRGAVGGPDPSLPTAPAAILCSRCSPPAPLAAAVPLHAWQPG
ncbi:uncharacterized protein HaLaN_07364 [Haematococcus lacustris]|uniref:Uncharacterized protein n=1 Tax=Haematococcus lacustris TaxID=44745 RepID=A0A699YRC6_HAELA|nr:uncharacterized protein HaLaN_07364 [Haematococcus lacustris]